MNNLIYNFLIMLKNKKIAVLMTGLFLLTNTAFADNKSDLLEQLSTLQTNFNELKTDKADDLESVVYDLSDQFDDVYDDLGYDIETVNYLVDLGIISSNFKEDLLQELTTINSEINTKVANELSDISTLKNTINLNYSSVSDSQLTSLQSQVDDIEDNYNDLDDSLDTKIVSLQTKYENSLQDYKSDLEDAISDNEDDLSVLIEFADYFDDLYTLKVTFDDSYEKFKNYYLANSSELSEYLEERQEKYVEMLRDDLEELKDANIEANSSLEKYESDIDRYIEILVDNFANAMYKYVDENFGVIYSSEDIDTINSRYTSLESTYYNTDGELIPDNVLDNSSNALSEVKYLKNTYTSINNTIKNLNGTGSTSTLQNIKFRMDTKFVDYYNTNFKDYREDLYVKLKEKLNFSVLETKNILLASDSIDIRLELLSDKITDSDDLDFINSKIASFQTDMQKYSYLNSDILTAKIERINYNLAKFVAEKELSFFEYNKLLKYQDSYDTQLDAIIEAKSNQYGDNAELYYQTIYSRVNAVLDTTELSTKNRFILLVVKLKLVEVLSSL